MVIVFDAIALENTERCFVLSPPPDIHCARTMYPKIVYYLVICADLAYTLPQQMKPNEKNIDSKQQIYDEKFVCRQDLNWIKPVRHN